MSDRHHRLARNRYLGDTTAGTVGDACPKLQIGPSAAASRSCSPRINQSLSLIFVTVIRFSVRRPPKYL